MDLLVIVYIVIIGLCIYSHLKIVISFGLFYLFLFLCPLSFGCFQEFAEARLYELWLKQKKLATRAEVGLVNTEEVSVMLFICV